MSSGLSCRTRCTPIRMGGADGGRKGYICIEEDVGQVVMGISNIVVVSVRVVNRLLKSRKTARPWGRSWM